MYRLTAFAGLLLILISCGRSEPRPPEAGAASLPTMSPTASMTIVPIVPTEPLLPPWQPGATPVWIWMTATSQPTADPAIPTSDPAAGGSPSPIIFTPVPPLYVDGEGLEIQAGICCVITYDGTQVDVTVRFTPPAPFESSVEMRVATGHEYPDTLATSILERQSWEPFAAEESYTVVADSLAEPAHRTCVQYRTGQSTLSPVYCDTIQIRVEPIPTAVLSPTPVPLAGSVRIDERISIHMEGSDSKAVEIRAEFAATSPHGPISEMRLSVGHYPIGMQLAEDELESAPWEPYVEVRPIPATAVRMQTFNWGVCVQFRDVHGNRTPVTCGGTLLEAK